MFKKLAFIILNHGHGWNNLPKYDLRNTFYCFFSDWRSGRMTYSSRFRSSKVYYKGRGFVEFLKWLEEEKLKKEGFRGNFKLEILFYARNIAI
jgi:hypothetical protein